MEPFLDQHAGRGDGRETGSGLALAALLLVAACTGLVTEPGGDSANAPLVCTEAQAEERGRTFDHMRRLSRTELMHTLAGLLGPELYDGPSVEGRLTGLPPDVTITAGDFAADPPVSLPMVLNQIARHVATVGLSDPAWRAAHLPACAADTDGLDEACAREVASGFGGAVYRRDLRSEEVDEYVAFYEDAGGGEEGLALLLRRLLSSPSLVFHIEEGLEGSDHGRIRLTPFEVASRISYFSTDGPPDDALTAAARAGELETLEQIRSHVERLLDTPEGRAKTQDFFRYYTRLDTPSSPPAQLAALHGIEDVSGLGLEMHEEAFDFIEYLLETSGTFSDLMLSEAAFPRSEAMAVILGTTIAEGDTPSTAVLHPGLFHRPAMLMSSGRRTNPIVRGAHIRKLFLCDTLGTPDAAAVAAGQEALGNASDLPNREAVAQVTSAGGCQSCHVQVNPLGYLFEGYDQLGAVRTEEILLDDDGAVVRTFPIDTAVRDPNLETGGPEALADSIELAHAMADSDKMRACFGRRLFEYYRRDEVDDRNDACTLLEPAILDRAASLRSMMVTMIANEDVFYREAPP